MVKTIRGAHADLRSVRAPESVSVLNVKGSRIDSLAGIERFAGVRQVMFQRARTDDLRALVPLKERLNVLRILEPVSLTDFDSILELHNLEALRVHLFDEEGARRASVARFERLPHLRELLLLGDDDDGLDIRADWFPALPELGHVWLGKFGIREEDTEAVCRASATLRHLQFRERSPEQTQRIAASLGPGVVHTWEPAEPSHGVIFELHGAFFVTLSFPRFDNSMDRDDYAQRLLRGKWKDLAVDLELDPDADEIVYHSRRRDVLEELVRRATAAGLV